MFVVVIIMWYVGGVAWWRVCQVWEGISVILLHSHVWVLSVSKRAVLRVYAWYFLPFSSTSSFHLYLLSLSTSPLPRSKVCAVRIRQPQLSAQPSPLLLRELKQVTEPLGAEVENLGWHRAAEYLIKVEWSCILFTWDNETNWKYLVILHWKERSS